jgi:hypothetical protein
MAALNRELQQYDKEIHKFLWQEWLFISEFQRDGEVALCGGDGQEQGTQMLA